MRGSQGAAIELKPGTERRLKVMFGALGNYFSVSLA